MANPGLSEIATTTIANRTKKVQDNVTKNNADPHAAEAEGENSPLQRRRRINEELSYAENGNASGTRARTFLR
jgi:hypothetical protein